MPGRDATRIARTLARISVLASATALVFGCAVLMAFDYMDFRASLVRTREIQARIVGANTAAALMSGDRTAAGETLRSLASAPRIEAAALYTPDGRLFASYARDAAGPPAGLPFDVPAGTVHHFEWFRLHLVHAVQHEGRLVGSVYIRSDLQEIADRMGRFALLTAGVLVVAVVAGLFVSRVLRDSISRPVVALADVAARVAAGRDYSLRAEVPGTGEIAQLASAFNAMLAEIQERDRSLRDSYEQLEARVRERTAELQASNRELEAFCYSVSHDLRAPLRSIDGFSLALVEDHGARLDPDATACLARIRAATQRMGQLIDDLLNLSRITRTSLRSDVLDMSALARDVAAELRAGEPDRAVDVAIERGMTSAGDVRLVRLALGNLIGNAWKFTSRREGARIEVGTLNRGGPPVFFVRDNGAGFDPAYADRLFGVFQRLHGATEFPGTGVGLAIVDRVVQRHGGRVWADGAVGRGATFYFTLARSQAESRAASA